MRISPSTLAKLLFATVILSSLACGKQEDDEGEEAVQPGETTTPTSGDQPGNGDEGGGDEGGDEGGLGMPKVGTPSTFELKAYNDAVHYHNASLYELIPKDEDGGPIVPDADITFTLTSSSGNIEIRDSDMATPVTTVTLAKSSSSRSFYLYGAAPGAATVTVSAAAPEYAAEITETVRLDPVASIFASAPYHVANDCQPLYLSLQNADDLSTVYSRTVSKDLLINVTAGNILVFGDQMCVTSSLSIATFPADTSILTLYYKATTDAVLTLTEGSNSHPVTIAID